MFNIFILDVGEVNYMFFDINCLLYVFFLNLKDIFVLMVKIVLLLFFNYKNLF